MHLIKLKEQRHICFLTQEFSAEAWDTKIARDIFWEESLHGYYKENVGIYPKDYQSEEEFLIISLERLFLRQLERGNHIILKPIRVEDYLDQKKLHPIRLMEMRRSLTL